MRPTIRLACGWLTLFVVGTDLFIMSPLLPAIAQEFRGYAASTGLSVTAFSLAYLSSAPLIGHLADRIGRRPTLVACLLGFAVANILTGMAPSFVCLLASRVAAGAAASGISPLIYAGVGEAAPAGRRATWGAIAVSGLLLALSVGAPLGTMIASRFGWRAPFFLIAILSLAMIVANIQVWPADRRKGGEAAAHLPMLGLVLVARRLLPTVFWATALYGVYTYLGVWLTSAGQSPSQVARAISCYGAGALVGTLFGGRLADHFGTRKTMLISLAGLAACLTALGAGLGTGVAADATLLFTSVFAQLFFPAQQAALVREFSQRRAFVLALNNSALFLGISIGSVVGGEAVARAGFAGAAATSAGIACIALLLIAVEDRMRPLTEIPSPAR